MKLYRFDYSCYARKVGVALDLCGLDYDLIDVPYGNRSELADLTGGYIHVPVLVDGADVVVDSRRICERLADRYPDQLVLDDAARGSIWAYADWCDTGLEEALFRLAMPGLIARFPTLWDRALFVLIKERKYGPGCIEAWASDREALLATGRRALANTATTLADRPFLFGDQPTLADAALYGQLYMQQVADELMPGRLGEAFVPWMRRVDEACAQKGR